MVDILLTVLLIIGIASVLYVLSTVCRRGHAGLSQLKGWAYAHRGLHGQGAPENSLEAFRRAVDAGYGMELDVHLLADGGLAVIHDSLLKRTTGREGRIEDLTVGQLRDFTLESTDETIPDFADVLAAVNGQVPLIVELKPAGNNYPLLCQKTCELLEHYNGVFCLESFDPRCIYWLRKNRPEMIRGQLTENYFRSQNSKLPWILKWILRNQVLNFLTQPDFVAYRYSDRNTFSNTLVRKLWNATMVTWTLRTPEEYATAVEEGWIPIFEGFNP